MKIRPSLAVLAASFVVLLASVPAAAEEQSAPGAPDAAAGAPELCSVLPVALPKLPAPSPVASCGFCSGADFCPQSGVRCTWDGSCTHGSSQRCNYTCGCDATCTTVSQVEEACSVEVPVCPPECPRKPVCQASYCGEEGIRCSFNGTCGSGGCCNYDCAPDATCILPDPLPINAC